jgi:hypothetical protein
VSDADLFEWTSLSPERTGLPVTLWVSVTGRVVTDPYDPVDLVYREAVETWTTLNRAILAEHWRGDIDGGEMAARSRPLP